MAVHMCFNNFDACKFVCFKMQIRLHSVVMFCTLIINVVIKSEFSKFPKKSLMWSLS
jgi:hypothetical protein